MTTKLNARIGEVTERIVERSRPSRQAYLARIDAAVANKPARKRLGCANFAHGFAACASRRQGGAARGDGPNLAIVTAYNDMLSAHQPYARFPDLIKEAARAAGGTAQVAGGVPAMCDGVTQGEKGMELSLFSRDVIALSTAVALSHDMFDAAVYLGICDKIVPGLLIGALSFGHLPAVFLPAGPMPSGLPNDEKSKVRQLFAEGKATRADLLAAEAEAYHAPGTCTFYGTANTNQMLMEIMGLHLPGASFVNPNTPLRDALTMLGVKRALAITALGNQFTPIGRIIDERAIVNGVVGLHATGGSTNLTIHLVAMAAAAGIALRWEDFADLAEVTPLLTRIYPNGKADVNHFHAAGGMGAADPRTSRRRAPARRRANRLGRASTIMRSSRISTPKAPSPGRRGRRSSATVSVLRGAGDPFQPTGGLRVLEGPLGRAVIKTSAVAPERHTIEAPARVFHSQEELHAAFRAGELNRDFVAVVRFQGPKAIGMPELHKLMPPLGVLQDRGHKVALVTDGRLSGASGKVPSAIHVTPEAAAGGAIGKIRNGDVIRLDAPAGRLEVMVADDVWARRPHAEADLSASHVGVGRELFSVFRGAVGSADEGAAIFPDGSDAAYG